MTNLSTNAMTLAAYNRYFNPNRAGLFEVLVGPGGGGGGAIMAPP